MTDATSKESLQVQPLTLTDAAKIRRLVALETGERAEVRLVMKHPPQQMPNYGEINRSGHDLHLWKQDGESFGIIGLSPFGWPGEQRWLWVRETWAEGNPNHYWIDGKKHLQRTKPSNGKSFGVLYKASFGAMLKPVCEGFSGWRSSVTMPRWAARIHLTVIDCRVEQVDGVWVWVGTVERNGNGK